jgi:membrane associated rhomboid family serine protease
MALYVVFFPRAIFDLDVYLGWWKVASRPATSKWAVLAWFIEQLVLAVVTSATHSIGIAFSAHVGGFVCGIIAGGILLMLGWREQYDARISADRRGARYKVHKTAAD